MNPKLHYSLGIKTLEIKKATVFPCAQFSNIKYGHLILNYQQPWSRINQRIVASEIINTFRKNVVQE